MKYDEFWTIMDENRELEIADMVEGKTPEQDAVVVRNNTTKRHYSISVPRLGEVRKDELVSLLKGQREALELVTITRIVGYYSHVENWNRSKLGELEDRRRGNYALEEAIPAAVPAMASNQKSMRAAG